MDHKELEYLGLGEKEAKVYLASLQLGKAPAQKIAEKAGVNRATTYVQIESLSRKGLMSTCHEGKKQFYFAESPDKLSLLFREQEAEIRKREQHLKKMLPELKSINVIEKDKPTVRYFEGKNGMLAMIEEFYQSDHKEPSQMIYSEELLNNLFSEDERIAFRNRRIGMNIKTEVIYNSSKPLKSTKDGTRLGVKSDKFPISCDIALFGNKLRLATLKNKISGLIIEDDEIAKTFKTIFRLAWIGAKKEEAQNN